MEIEKNENKPKNENKKVIKMRKTKVLTFLSIFALISIITISIPILTNAEKSDPRFEKSWDVEGISGTSIANKISLDGVEPDFGNTWWLPVIDDSGLSPYGYYWQPFENIFNGTYGNIWIGLSEYDWYDDGGTPDDVLDDVWYFSYPWTDEGIVIPDQGYPDDYYMKPGYVDTVTALDLLEVLEEFDNNIHNTDVEHFGMYQDRPGPFGDYKTQILVFNIRDQFFYDPVNAPGFIEGYFWGSIADQLGANAFHMDTFQWWRRQGGDPPIPTEYSYLDPHPWEYEGTFAHEFQHLIHHDVDGDELSWVNEGCSTLAEWICGYGFSPGHISEYLLWFWDTSLVVWDQYLSNYGAVFLWTFYMYEHYGGASLIWDLTHEQTNGIEGWNNVLDSHGICKDFDAIFQDWAIANYLDEPSIYGGKYGYFELDLPSADSGWWDIPSVMEMWETGNPDFFDWLVDQYPNHGTDYPYGASLPYVVNYVEFTKEGASLLKFNFDGDDFSGVLPYSGMNEWHSGDGNFAWYQLGQTFNIPAEGATLQFMTYYEIELDWDYGYVEVYDHTSGEWITLSGLGTVSTLPFNYETDNPNCPDQLEPSSYLDAGNWNAFTGSSYGWYLEEMDLSPFAGHEIDLFFTYWTDPYINELGWYLDDISIPEIEFFDDVESGAGDWVQNMGWYLTDGAIENDFEVSFLNTMTFQCKKDSDPFIFYSVDHMHLSDESETGLEYLFVGDFWKIESSALMVAANQPGFEHTFMTSYTFEAQVAGRGHCWRKLI
ncbi:MAG: hypothetical protein GF317_12325 [Candidatus Lokiarchaeota archaeon]|nr:hypothetical protein [Candidatus Lokiarchaeota archaeon]MBD3200434.1 hypothetical protein [Candidatus Lokiarchaeota archaeon]